MKYIIAIAYLLLSFNMNALELDSVRRKEIVREGQAEFCQLLEYNSHCTSPDQMKFTVVIDGNEPSYSRVIENRVDTTGIQILSATCYDSLNAVLSRVYRDYHIEMYMIVIKTFDIAVTTPLTQPIVINNLFNNPLYDEQTNLAQLRNWHKGITEDIIQNTLSPRNRDCLVYSRAWYRGALIPGSVGEWMFSKRVCHYANTRTYPKLDELHTYFASRIINNPSVQNSGFEYSLQAVSREFAESAKYISLKAAILTTFTSSSLNAIFAQFNESVDYGGLTEQERIHALAVYSGYTMFDNGISREEYYACKIVENTPRAQVAAFFLHLDDVSPLNSHPNYNGNKPNQALIVSLIQQIDDAVFGNDGDNYARFIRGLTSIMMSDEYYAASRMPQTSEEWIQRQIYWDDWHVFTVAPVGTHDYDITLQATGNIEVSHKVVSNHQRHNPPNGGEPYYTAVWDNTYAPYTLQPFDRVIFTNRSSLGMLQVAGAAPDEPFIAPAILLKYADDKAFNTNAITVTAIALDVIAIATGPFAIGAALSANNIALAAFEALQFIGSSANIVANIYANPAIQEAVNMFNNIVAAWGISRIAVSGVKYTADYINAAKSGDLQPVPVSIAQTYRTKYSQVTDWSTMDPAVQGRMRRMDELLARQAATIASEANLVQSRTLWLSQLENQYGPFNINNFQPEGLPTSSVPINTYNEMLSEYPSGLSLDLKTGFLAELIKSGSTVPIKRACLPGEVLYKLVPEGKEVSSYTAYFISPTEFARLKNSLTIEQELGLPLGSHSVKYDVYAITANQNTNVFESICASTIESGYHTTGGATQTLVINRSNWSAPVKLPSLIPPHE
jgi:hypothetical protein